MWTVCALGLSLCVLLSRHLACDSTETGVAAPPPLPGEVAISEVMAQPHQGRPEWVELASRAPGVRTLDGCALADGGDSAHVVFVNGPLLLDPWSQVVVAETDVDPAGGVATDEILGDTALVLDEGDPDETMALYCPDGSGSMVLIDEIEFGAMGDGVDGRSWMAVAASSGEGVQWCLADASQAYHTADGEADCGTPREANMCGASAATPGTAGQLQITEIMVAPDAGREWFELRNTGDELLDLAGCTLGEGGDGTVHEHAVVADRGVTSVGAGELLVLAATELDLVGAAGPLADYAYSGLTFNNSDAEQLWISCAGVEIERVAYDWAATEGERGQSLGRDPEQPETWCLSTASFYEGDEGAAWGSPGQTNEACAAVVSGKHAPLAGEVVITELMIAPSSGSVFPEWIEVINVSDRQVDLTDCLVEDDGHSGDLDAELWLDPGALAVLAQDEADPSCALRVRATYGGAVTFNNGGTDRAALVCPDGGGGWSTIDEVGFDWESLDLDKGRSWVLDADAVDAVSNDDPARWCGAPDGVWSCTIDGHTDIGTPGVLSYCD